MTAAHLPGEEGNLNADEVGNQASEEQIRQDCDAQKLSFNSENLSCDSKSISSTWEAPEDSRISCGGEGRTKISKTSANIESEPECRDENGAPSSGCPFSPFKKKLSVAHMGQIPQDGKNEQYVALFFNF